jgi:D-alanyl-lipoteichoic acid acyltransferase DltB (MBOAT superfamily)
LSSWLRDYLFIPLGGSRGSGPRICVNLMIVMGLGGLWHGAGWNYIVFGLAMGAWLCLHRGFRDWAVSQPRLDKALRTPVGTGLRINVTDFLTANFAWRDRENSKK